MREACVCAVRGDRRPGGVRLRSAELRALIGRRACVRACSRASPLASRLVRFRFGYPGAEALRHGRRSGDCGRRGEVRVGAWGARRLRRPWRCGWREGAWPPAGPSRAAGAGPRREHPQTGPRFRRLSTARPSSISRWCIASHRFGRR